MKRICRILLIAGLMLCMAAGALAAPLNGLRVSVTSDKTNYEETDMARLMVRVENPMDEAVRNVRITHNLPKGLEYAAGAGSYVIDEIPAKWTVTQSFYISKRADGLIVTLRTDKDHYKENETAKVTITVTNPTRKRIKNVEIEHFLPNGLQYETGRKEYLFNHMTIEPGETVEHVVYVRKMDQMPKTGDDSAGMIGYYAILLIGSVLLLCKCRKKMC